MRSSREMPDTSMEVSDLELWIRNDGMCEQYTLEDIVQEFCDASYTVLAFYSDHFQGAKGDRLPDLLNERDKLLELRVFSKDRELWMHRTALGSPFGWRIADDNTLKTNVLKLEDPFWRYESLYRFPSYQMLDIDETYPPYLKSEKDEFDCLYIRSTVKGRYALPITKGDSFIRLVNYVRYDGNGVANIVDYRLAEFTPDDREEGV